MGPFRPRQLMPSIPSIQSDELQGKYEHLLGLIEAMGRVIVAFSGGVDSTVVLKVALQALGSENVLAATGVSPSLPQRELQSVKDLAEILSAPLELIQTSEMDSPNYSANPSNRCYYCKTELYSKLTELAAAKNYNVILNGLN